MSGVTSSKSSSCFVPGCKTGYSSDRKLKKERGETVASLFKAPNDPVTLQQWQRVIPRADKIFSVNNVVCSLHFPQEDILNFYETKLADGTINRIKRGRPTLKNASVPSIFPNLPSYLTNNKKRRKPPSDRSVSNIKRKCLPLADPVASNITPAEGGTPEQNLEQIAAKSVVDVIDRTFTSTSTMFDNLKKHNLEQVVDKSVIDVGAFTMFEDLKNSLSTICTPNKQWSGTFIPGKNEVVFAEWDDTYNSKKKIVIRHDMSFKVMFGNIDINLEGRDTMISSFDELENIMKAINGMGVCAGIKLISTSELCTGIGPLRRPGQKGILSNSCLSCKLEHANKKKKGNKSFIARRHEKLKGVVRCVTRKNLRLKQKVNKLINDVEESKKKCANIATETLEEIILGLPSTQQEAVRMCFAAAKVSHPKNRRYTLAWIYECLLIRIKGRAGYEHLRRHKILPFPCIETLNKYISKMNGCYGFQKSTFELLKKKSSYMKPEERRGTLLIDEMKLIETLVFNKKTLQVHGFTDLGKYTPLHQRNQKGDHALVMMFQPFRGSWIQSLECFLSKGCASATVLHHLIMECIILLEKTGFSIDVVTTDGASWNRAMWKKFNISEENVSCQHICDPSRQLWFASDFPHLMKNFRNFIIQRSETWTPDGVVQLAHWDTVVELEQPNSLSLKICPRLCRDDVHPKHYQKMNVGRAYRFFSEKTAAAMELYKKENSNLGDCEPSVKLIKRMSTLIEIMSSRTPLNKTLKQGSTEEQFLKDFLVYLQDWERYAKANNFLFLSASTYHGLIVTLKTTLGVMNFLCDNYEYKYLMTAKLNQDALERFFGMMRSACGSNDHPDSRLFIQMFRLISTYSLVKPPKGSNVEGSEMLRSLLNVNEIVNSEENITRLRNGLDSILENEFWFDDNDVDTKLDHNYNIMGTSHFVLSYISGYIARKATRFSKCENCLQDLKSTEPQEKDQLINLLSKGFLIYPSLSLHSLISTIESTILDVSSRHTF